MALEYYIKDVVVTGTQSSKQTIAYNSLTDVISRALPATFGAIPWIAICNWDADRKPNISEKTTTNFKIALSDLTGEMSITSVTCDLLIVGST